MNVRTDAPLEQSKIWDRGSISYKRQLCRTTKDLHHVGYWGIPGAKDHIVPRRKLTSRDSSNKLEVLVILRCTASVQSSTTVVYPVMICKLKSRLNSSYEEYYQLSIEVKDDKPFPPLLGFLGPSFKRKWMVFKTSTKWWPEFHASASRGTLYSIKPRRPYLLLLM